MTDSPLTFSLIPDAPGERLDILLAKHVKDVSRTRLKALILEGHISSPSLGLLKDPSYIVKKAATFYITFPEIKEVPLKAQPIPLEILYEDFDLLVINKPAGMVVHPAPGHFENTLVNALLAHCGESLSGISGERRPGIVHRLDKETSGLMVVAKNDQAHQALSAQFSDRTLSRVYKALIWGVINPLYGEIEGNIGRHPKNRQKMALLKHGGRTAKTFYKTLETFKNTLSLIECKLATGRTHQIRVHLSAQGHPLLGDPIYGKAPKSVLAKQVLKIFAKIEWSPERQALHAATLKFKHPKTLKEMTFASPLPQDMENLLLELKTTFLKETDD